jgi:histone H2B
MFELTTRSPLTQPNSTASKAPASKAAKAPASSAGQQKAARKTSSKEDGDLKKKRKKARRETYSSYIYKGVCSAIRFRLHSNAITG